MKKILVTAVTVLAVAAVVLLSSHCGGLVEQMENTHRSTVLSDPDLNLASDGVFTGSARNGIVRVKVRVKVSNHRIERIDILRHFNGQGKPAEAIVDAVVRAQNLQADLVTGASYSSKVILMAVEDALLKAVDENDTGEGQRQGG